MLVTVAAAGAAILLLYPLWLAPLPPLTDYPNHLARLWLLSGGEQSPTVKSIYAVRWDSLTNIAIDLIAVTVGRIASYEVAGTLSLVASIVLPPLGGALLWRVAHGRWHWWPLAFTLLAWGEGLLNGFLNFQIGVGAALLAAALDGRIAPLRPAAQIAARCAITAVLLACHPFAVAFYLVLIAALAWGASLRPPRRDLLRVTLFAGASCAITGVVFLLLSSSPPGTQEHAGLSTLLHDFRAGLWDLERQPGRKAANLFAVLESYAAVPDALSGAALLLPLAAAVALRRLAVHTGMLLAGVFLALCYIAFPNYLLGAYWVDARFAIMAPFALVAAFAPSLPTIPGAACAGVLLAAAGLRTAGIGAVWQDREADLASVARAYQAVPEGSRVLPLEIRPADWTAAPIGRYLRDGHPTFRHDPTLGLPWRHAFVPTIFAARGKQPIAVRPPFDAISEPNGGQLADIHVLDRAQATQPGIEFAAYVADWKSFDYVLVVNADLQDRSGPLDPVPGLTLVADQGFARIYRIHHK